MVVDLDPPAKTPDGKLIRELKEFNDTIRDKIGTKEFEEIASSIVDGIDSLDALLVDENITDDLNELLSPGKMSDEQLEQLIQRLSDTGEAKKFQAFLKMLLDIRNENYDSIVNTAKEAFGKELSGAPLRILHSSLSRFTDYSYLAQVLSANNIYEHDLLDEFLSSMPGRTEISEVAENFIANGNTKAASEFLKNASGAAKDPEISLFASRVLIEAGDTDSASRILNSISFEDLEGAGNFKDMVLGLKACDNYKPALRVVNFAVHKFKQDPDFVVLKAQILGAQGKQDEALEILDGWPDKSTRIILNEKADILFSAGRYQEYADLIPTIFPDGVDDQTERDRYITSLIQDSRFHDALQEIGKSLSKNPDDLSVLRQKFKLENMLNEISRAYETAEKVISIDTSDRECSDFVLDHMFSNGEYEKFIQRYESLVGVGEENKGRLIAALLYNQELDDAVERITSDHTLLSSPDVVDAIFFTVRDDDHLTILQDICEKDEYSMAMIAIYRIRGKQIHFDSKIWERVKSIRSQAVIWGVAMETTNFRDRSKPELVNALLSDTRYANLSNLMEAINLVYAGKYFEEMTDNRRFMYPLSEALIENGMTREAEAKLEQAHDPTKRSDPFYNFLLSRIHYIEGDESAARKSILRSLGKLKNKNFLLQQMRIAIKQDDPDSIMSSLDGIRAIDELDRCDLSELYTFLSEEDQHEFADRVLAQYGDESPKNIWISRLKRDQLVRENEFEGAERVSRKIIVNNARVVDDLRKHAILLKNTNRESERVDFLVQEEKETGDPQIEIWLGDYYFLKKQYQKALEAYEKSMQKGTKEEDIKNLPEVLIELGEFERVEEIITKKPGNEIPLIKLYHRTGRILEIAELLRNINVTTKEDEAVIQYISRILWVNRKIRDTLIEMFNATGNLFLGKIIAEHLAESRDFENAERIMREILKLYPEDANNIKALSDLLVENNRPTDAANIILKAVRKLSGKPQRDLAERLMRIYFEIGEYRALLDFFWKNTWVISQTNIQWVIRSLIENSDFDAADQLAGQYHGTLLKEEDFKELVEEINLRKEFLDVLSYAAAILKAEYKRGKVMTSEEMVYYTGVPVDMVARVIQLINSEEYYRQMEEGMYESVSRDVIQRIVRKSTVETIRDLKIYVIFSNLPKKDVILAKNIFIYIRRTIEKKREPLLNDPEANSLLKSAIKSGLRPEPLDVAYNLNLGISYAMDIIALMEYMAKLNS